METKDLVLVMSNQAPSRDEMQNPIWLLVFVSVFMYGFPLSTWSSLHNCCVIPPTYWQKCLYFKVAISNAIITFIEYIMTSTGPPERWISRFSFDISTYYSYLQLVCMTLCAPLVFVLFASPDIMRLGEEIATDGPGLFGGLRPHGDESIYCSPYYMYCR